MSREAGWWLVMRTDLAAHGIEPLGIHGCITCKIHDQEIREGRADGIRKMEDEKSGTEGAVFLRRRYP